MRKTLLLALSLSLVGLAAGATRPNGPLVPYEDNAEWCIYRYNQSLGCGPYSCAAPCYEAYAACVTGCGVNNVQCNSGCDQAASLCVGAC